MPRILHRFDHRKFMGNYQYVLQDETAAARLAKVTQFLGNLPDNLANFQDLTEHQFLQDHGVACGLSLRQLGSVDWIDWHDHTLRQRPAAAGGEAVWCALTLI